MFAVPQRSLSNGIMSGILMSNSTFPARATGELKPVLLADPGPLVQLVEDVGSLVGVPVRHRTGTEQVPPTSLILTEPHYPAIREHHVPVVSVSATVTGADLQVPADTHLLAQVLLESQRNWAEMELGPRTTYVAGWQGGAGTSTICRQLVQAAGGLLLDASGNPTGEEVGTADLHWGKISAHDPPLVDEIAQLMGESSGWMQIQSKLPQSIQVDDPRVQAVLGVSGQDAVVDAGTWKPQLEKALLKSVAAGRQVRLILVGNTGTEDCYRLLNVLGEGTLLWSPQLLLTRSRVSEQLQLVSAHWDIPAHRVPGLKRKNERVWQNLLQQLWDPHE